MCVVNFHFKVGSAPAPSAAGSSTQSQGPLPAAPSASSSTTKHPGPVPAVPSALRITLDGSSPLEQALECYQRKLPLMVWRRFLSLLQLLGGFLRDSGEMDVIAGSVMLPFATACSGTDIGMVAGCVFLKWLQAKCGLAWALEHNFACEKVPWKRAFLRSQFPVRCLFSDVAELVSRSAMCQVARKMCYVPWTWLFMAGFSCKSRTAMSSRRAGNKNCVQEQDTTTETSFTWEYIFQYIQQRKPRCVILENVKQLLEKSLDPDVASDAEYIVGQFAQVGYHCIVHLFDAADHGSRASRLRIYFLAWQLHPSLDNELVKKRLQWCVGLLDHMVIPPFHNKDFLTMDLGQLDAFCSQRTCAGKPFSSGDASDTDEDAVSGGRDRWRDEHCAAYKENGLKWPLSSHPMLQMTPDSPGTSSSSEAVFSRGLQSCCG